MATPAEQLSSFLTAKGKRFTAQMAKVVDTAFALEGTFSAEDVASLLQGDVSRATVYRTLHYLVQADLLRQVRFNEQDVYVATARPAG